MIIHSPSVQCTQYYSIYVQRNEQFPWSWQCSSFDLPARLPLCLPNSRSVYIQQTNNKTNNLCILYFIPHLSLYNNKKLRLFYIIFFSFENRWQRQEMLLFIFLFFSFLVANRFENCCGFQLMIVGFCCCSRVYYPTLNDNLWFIVCERRTEFVCAVRFIFFLFLKWNVNVCITNAANNMSLPEFFFCIIFIHNKL